MFFLGYVKGYGGPVKPVLYVSKLPSINYMPCAYSRAHDMKKAKKKISIIRS